MLMHDGIGPGLVVAAVDEAVRHAPLKKYHGLLVARVCEIFTHDTLARLAGAMSASSAATAIGSTCEAYRLAYRILRHGRARQRAWGRFSKSKPGRGNARRLDHKGAFHDRHGVWGAAVSQRVDLIEVAARTRPA